MKTMSYYFCDSCHFCFKASILPNRCPDCGKRIISILPAVRMATVEEIADYVRIRKELDAEEGTEEEPVASQYSHICWRAKNTFIYGSKYL